MKPYLVRYENGNGYSCHCCRTTWNTTDTMEFENDEEAKIHAENYNKGDNRDRDSKITSIYALTNINPIYQD